jgi:hypothetical protein
MGNGYESPSRACARIASGNLARPRVLLTTGLARAYFAGAPPLHRLLLAKLAEVYVPRHAFVSVPGGEGNNRSDQLIRSTMEDLMPYRGYPCVLFLVS